MSDIVPIAAGIAGFDRRTSACAQCRQVWRRRLLIGYGYLRPGGRGDLLLIPSGTTPVRLAEVLVTCAAFTFLNPHVYLDTVVKVRRAGQRAQRPSAVWPRRVTASAVWFATLGFEPPVARAVHQPRLVENPRFGPDRVMMVALGISLTVT